VGSSGVDQGADSVEAPQPERDRLTRFTRLLTASVDEQPAIIAVLSPTGLGPDWHGAAPCEALHRTLSPRGRALPVE
jgi:hypothetical protein